MRRLRAKSRREGVALGGLCLVFGGGKVEEGFVVTSFLLPIAYQVLDAVLLMGRFCEEFLFVVQKELEFFFSPIQSAFPAIEPLGFCKSAILIQLMEEAVAESYGGNKKNSKEDKHPFGYCQPPLFDNHCLDTRA